MWAALELVEGGFAHVAASRLKVCAHEDVGTGSIERTHFALRCVDDFEEWHPTKRQYRLALANAVLALAEAPTKSRSADDLQAYVRWQRATAPPPTPPDAVWDKHTGKGRALGRGIQHFVEEATLLLPKDVSNPKWKAVALESYGYLTEQKQLAKQREREEKLAATGQTKLEGTP